MKANKMNKSLLTAVNIPDFPNFYKQKTTIISHTILIHKFVMGSASLCNIWPVIISKSVVSS